MRGLSLSQHGGVCERWNVPAAGTADGGRQCSWRICRGPWVGGRGTDEGSLLRVGVSLQGRQARGLRQGLRTSPETGLQGQEQGRAGTGRRALAVELGLTTRKMRVPRVHSRRTPGSKLRPPSPSSVQLQVLERDCALGQRSYQAMWGSGFIQKTRVTLGAPLRAQW